MPSRSISEALNGEITPKSVMLIVIASPIVACDHPNSMWSGSIITLGTDRNPAAPRMATKVTAAMIQARCGLARGSGFTRRFSQVDRITGAWQDCHYAKGSCQTGGAPPGGGPAPPA